MALTTSVPDTPGPSFYRRKSQVFVEIPPSPLFKARVASTPSKVDDLSIFHRSNSHKESPPPLSTKTSMNNVPTENQNNGKRRAQDDDDDDRANLLGAKRAKLLQSNKENEVVACHQCRSKKPSNSVLQCTGISKTTRNRCKASYCDICLKNRYGKELKTIAPYNSLDSREGDGDGLYDFICPRCDGNCNCAPCRKRRGLAPVGKFSVQDGESVREILEKNPEASGILPKHTAIPAPQAPKPSKVNVLKTVDISEDATQGSKVPRKKRDTVGDAGTKKKPKIVPEPIWIPIPHIRSKHDVEERIHLREFVLRFNPILNIGLRNLEELDDFGSLHDPSTKAILLSLLDLLAIEDDTQKKRIQDKVKIIRSLGLNWTKIVPVLFDLRNSMPKGHALSVVPDLSPSDTETSYNTRGAKMQGVSADQLLPILLYLIQVAGDGPSVRQELEEGCKQAKQARAAYSKASREEAERWAAERAELTEQKPGGEMMKTKEGANAWKIKFRSAEAEHKAIIGHIHNSHKLEMDCCAPRFTNLGCDTKGRTYYTLSASGHQQGKKERLPSESERFAMKRWGWFLAVHGKPGTIIQHGSEDNTDEDEDEDESNTERWWGFADVEEMRNLSKWLAYCAEADINIVVEMKPAESSAEAKATSTTLTPRLPSPSGTTTISYPGSHALSTMSNLSDSQLDEDRDYNMDIDRDNPDVAQPATLPRMKALAKAILEYADFIDWRLNRHSTCTKRKGDDTIAPTQFYN